MDRERIASRRHTNVTPADKRKHMVVDRVFDARATLCEVACQGVLAWLRDAKKPRAAEAENADAYGIVAWRTRDRTLAVQRFGPLLSYCPNALQKVRFAAV
ncbi:TPA: hypothetical protein ACOD9T_002184 [Stenotrophomonas maltophilia]